MFLTQHVPEQQCTQYFSPIMALLPPSSRMWRPAQQNKFRRNLSTRHCWFANNV